MRKLQTLSGVTTKICKQHSSCNVPYSFFTERAVNIWNGMNVDTDFSSLDCFIWNIKSLDILEFCCSSCCLCVFRLRLRFSHST